MSEPITRDVLFDVAVDPAQVTQHVEARRIRIASNQAAGAHVHNGPVVGHIVEGSVVFQLDGEPPSVLEPGDVFYEPAGVVIARFDARDDGVTFLAYFLLEADQQPEIAFADA
jgi:quercetin dioxygenase-like cupin family protein